MIAIGLEGELQNFNSNSMEWATNRNRLKVRFESPPGPLVRSVDQTTLTVSTDISLHSFPPHAPSQAIIDFIFTEVSYKTTSMGFLQQLRVQ